MKPSQDDRAAAARLRAFAFSGKLLALAAGVLLIAPRAGGDEVSVVAHPPTDTRSDHYAGYREPLLSTPLVELPVGTVEPRGWLRKQLELQAAGFHGHLGEISRFLEKEGNAWLNPAGKGDHGWEEVPYWLKGYLLTAYLLNDPDQIEEAHLWIEAALKSAQQDGWFGPQRARSTVSSTEGEYDLWPNMIMLFCLQAYHERTEDPRVLELMTDYFRFELSIPDEQFLPPYWQQQRAADNLYSVYWLYNRTGDEWLLDLASKIHRNTARWTDGVANWHNVNMSQAFGGPTTYYVQSGDRKHLQAAYGNYNEIRRKYGRVPGGMFGGDENCREGYIGPRQAVETCGMVEMMLSNEVLANITGDILWADRCEDVAFNSLPAALTADFRALRYLTAPNHVLSDRKSKSPGLQNGGPMYLMDPTGHRCCQHNFGHGWPYFTIHLWSATPDNGLATVLYSASDITARVGSGETVTIHQRTHYPFDEEIELLLETDGPTTFPLYLRIPSWCNEASVELNGEVVREQVPSKHFLCIDRAWNDGDIVTLRLPMEIRLRRWEVNQDSVSVDRGPLTYSLRIGERKVPIRTAHEEWPAFEIHPTTPWNYALVVDQDSPADSFEVVRRDWPTNDMPFTLEGVPVELKAKGKRIEEWQLDELGLVGSLQPSPVKTDAPPEPITLVPMGAARLRVSSFPVAGSGPDAHRWEPPPQPRYETSASHCWGSDTVRALCDDIIPDSSGDHSIPRMTWWSHRGTREWVQYDFQQPREVNKVRVYWFDDRNRNGHCRVPASWEVLYLPREGDGDNWLLVPNASAYDVKADQFNTVEFSPVQARALRLRVQLQDDFSGGILEWQLEPTEEAD